jgi:DNA-binding transcriptional MerR regulator
VEPSLRIGEVARAAGVRKSLIRYYEGIGLIPRTPRVSGQRRYDESVLRRLAVIDVAQRAGPSLDEIRDLLEIGSDPLSPRLRALARRRLPGDRGADRALCPGPGVAGGGFALRVRERRRVRAVRRPAAARGANAARRSVIRAPEAGAGLRR